MKTHKIKNYITEDTPNTYGDKENKTKRHT